jgi:hypothetical protein
VPAESEERRPQGPTPAASASTAPAPPRESNEPGPLPAIHLPKGGGAIRGIGEKFSVNTATGSGSVSVPIATSPGRSGFGPQLSLRHRRRAISRQC